MFLFGCGYSSIYQNQKTQNFQINVTDIKGDEVMNNLIKNQIKLYSNKKSNKIYNLTIDTIYVKDILTKNSSGVITDYTLSVTSIFSIDLNNQTKIFKFKEKINIKNQTDTFEQNIYEKNIKRNFASSIKEKLISAILSLNDN
tara:strand:+ start:1182 stop:1610 length:429 start_codon:yes stop_codon:yes gene_type:complete